MQQQKFRRRLLFLWFKEILYYRSNRSISVFEKGAKYLPGHLRFNCWLENYDLHFANISPAELLVDHNEKWHFHEVATHLKVARTLSFSALSRNLVKEVNIKKDGTLHFVFHNNFFIITITTFSLDITYQLKNALSYWLCDGTDKLPKH